MAPVTKRDQPGDPAGLAQPGDPAVFGTRYSVLGKEEPRVPGTGYPVPSTEYPVPSTQYPVPSTEQRSGSRDQRTASSKQRAASSGLVVPAVVLVLRPRAADDLLRGQRR